MGATNMKPPPAITINFVGGGSAVFNLGGNICEALGDACCMAGVHYAAEATDKQMDVAIA